MLEVKRKTGRGQTEKLRMPIDASQHGALDDAAFEFVRGVCRRPALAPASGTGAYDAIPTDDVRRRRRQHGSLTIDMSRPRPPRGGSVQLTGSIIETKAPHSPGLADRWMWRHGQRPGRFSKYCTMLAALEPTLPANKWHRTLQRVELNVA